MTFVSVCSLRAKRLQQLKREYEQTRELLAKGHGEYREVAQDEFLKEVTGSPLVAVHFYHRDFERCKIMDMVRPLRYSRCHARLRVAKKTSCTLSAAPATRRQAPH